MLAYPNIDPVIVHLGPLAIRWYGMAYLCGFLFGYLLTGRQRREGLLNITSDQLSGLVTAMILGVILGGRLGYVLFYDLPHYFNHPLQAFAIWRGGMSFHGGLLGTLVAGALYCRSEKLPYLSVADRVAVVVPVGLFFGRVANFINGELWGRTTDMPWGMIFPYAGALPRHPSQIYEALLEGLLLFALMWLMRKRLARPGALLGLFMVSYGILRVFVEFFREPDAQVGFLFSLVTMGQVLSGVMLAVGAWLLWSSRRREPVTPLPPSA
ncbi:MAG: prolipoprotein diacylglyceryl transferase [Nitrospirota bacterium]|nr:prolipoprotein diacylglyceryl transferase [Nitrospirota bacterium]